MNETPSNVTTERARPKLVIFDDRGKLLKAFTDKFTELGYDVTPVYVSDGTYDHVIRDGRFKRGPMNSSASDDWREQDKLVTPEHNLERAYADAKERLDAGNRRYGLDVDMYEGMLALPENARAITNEEGARAVLAELKPDCVLTDFEMRRAGDKMARNTLMGTDVMRVAGEVCPTSVRALHSSLYTYYNAEDFDSAMENPDTREEYQAAHAAAGAGGYLLSSKDTSPFADYEGSDQYSNALDGYFRNALVPARMPAATKPRLLLVDDKARLLPGYVAGMEAQGFEVVAGHYAPDDATGAEGFTHFGSVEAIAKYAMNPFHRIDAVLTDIDYEGYEFGKDVVKRLRALHCTKPVFGYTAGYSDDFRDIICCHGANDLFIKPAFPGDAQFPYMGERIHAALDKQHVLGR